MSKPLYHVSTLTPVSDVILNEVKNLTINEQCKASRLNTVMLSNAKHLEIYEP